MGELIRLHKEVTVEQSMEIPNDYWRYIFGEDEVVDMGMTIEYTLPARPLNGPSPRFALWGAKGRIIQIGSKQDKSWKRRHIREIHVHIPRVVFDCEES